VIRSWHAGARNQSTVCVDAAIAQSALKHIATGCLCLLRIRRWPDSFRFGSFRFGSFRFGSFRFGSFRFGSFRFGSFRFDSFRFDSFRFYSGHIFEHLLNRLRCRFLVAQTPCSSLSLTTTLAPSKYLN
jgi:hypothetical protein